MGKYIGFDIMIGVILAAGMGTRLRPLTDGVSKPLLEINGESLLERMIKNFLNENITKFIVITGYFSEKTDELCMKLEEQYGIQIKTIKNEEYDVTNTSVSTYLASSFIEDNNLDDDFILINGDNVLDPKIIHNINESPYSSIIVDNAKTLNEESFKLIIKDGVILGIGKELPIAESSGEFIGVSKIINNDLEEFNELLRETIDDNPQNYYDYVFEFLSRKTKLDYVYTNGLQWTEIDDHDDYDFAKELLSLDEFRL